MVRREWDGIGLRVLAWNANEGYGHGLCMCAFVYEITRVANRLPK